MEIPLLNAELLGNALIAYVTAILVLLISILLLRLFKFVVLKYLVSLSKKTKTRLDDILVGSINDIGWPFYILLSIYIASSFIPVKHTIINLVLRYGVLIVAVYYAIRFIQSMIDHAADRAVDVKGDKVGTSAIRLISNFAKWILWIIAFVFILDNIGIDITPLIAGMGIGGIAIAFALQGVLTDVFASISIALDKPFEVGDYIVLGTDSGVVEKIGVKSTRIKTLQGQELIVSNKELTETRVNNYKRMAERRAVFSIGVVYDTPHAKLKKIPQIISDILKNMKDTRLDRVHFREFGPSSLNYEIVFYVANREYRLYMDRQEHINLALVKAFQKEKIEFAYPTQTLYVHKAK